MFIWPCVKMGLLEYSCSRITYRGVEPVFFFFLILFDSACYDFVGKILCKVLSNFPTELHYHFQGRLMW